MADHWLCVDSRSACYAVAFAGPQILYGAPYGMAVARRIQTTDIRVFKRHVERGGAKTWVLRKDGTIRP